MAKNIMQFRYYGDSNKQNYPSNPKLTKGQLGSGSAFSSYYPITQLGIQALPGTKFYLNNGLTPIIIGVTGIYELDLEGLSQINHLKFDLQSLNLISSDNNAYLIVDIVYGD